MARHYYRTNVPLPIMFLKWIGLGILAVIFLLYDTCANGPKRAAQREWDRQHFNGWRLESSYDTEHGLYYDKLDGATCTTKGYPGYPACPTQRYYVNGQPSNQIPQQ
jgi:hypothetical protein